METSQTISGSKKRNRGAAITEVVEELVDLLEASVSSDASNLMAKFDFIATLNKQLCDYKATLGKIADPDNVVYTYAKRSMKAVQKKLDSLLKEFENENDDGWKDDY